MSEVMVHLRGIGTVPGKRVVDLEPGDVIMWDFGAFTHVLEIKQQGPKSLIEGRYWNKDHWSAYSRVLSRSRPVAIVPPEVLQQEGPIYDF